MATRATASARSFVGRSRELDILGERLHAVLKGRGAVCLVSGEAGIGKSRLVAEFVDEAQRAGAAVHAGLAWEAGGAPAYWPWIQVLRSVIASHGDDGALIDPRRAAPLARLVPELVDGGIEAARLEAEQARFQLMDAVSGVLRSAASRRPLLLVLEDLHAADADSLVLLEFVARVLRNATALVVATYRDAELDQRRAGGALLRVRREAVEIRLGRLGRDEVREYLRIATGQRPLEQTVTELHARTEGHPFYLAELVELGMARGNFASMPQSLRTTLTERTLTLPDATRSRLGVASVLGREFALAAVAELAELPTATVEADLGPAIAARLVERLDEEHARFEHMLVREALHEGLPVAVRRALHRRRARALERRAGSEAETPWAELAHHLDESGPELRVRAVVAWRRAAHQAGARQAFDDAALCLARALDALGPEPAAAERASLLLELATAQIRAGDMDAGRGNAVAAFTIGESLGDAALMADAALAYGAIFTYARVDPTLVRLLRTALQALGPEASGRKARILARLASAMQPAADPHEPMQLAREAIGMARSMQDAPTLLVTLRSAISALMDVGDPAERLALNREHVALAHALEDPCESMRGHMRMVVDALELGEAATLDEAIAHCAELATRLALPQYRWTAAAFATMRSTMRGDFAAAEELLAEAAGLAERAQDPNAVRTLAIQRLAIAEARERHEEVMQLTMQLERLFADIPLADTFLRPSLLASRVRIPGVAVRAESLDADYVAQVLRFRDVGAISCLGEFVAVTGRADLAARIHADLLARRTHCAHWGLFGMRWEGPVARVLGLLAVALGKPAEADEHFTAALRIARRMGARPWVARICTEWAVALSGRDDAGARTQAGALLEEAGALAAALELRALARRVSGLQGTVASAAKPQTGLPAVAYFRLACEGEVWVCECEGRVARLRDSRGLRMLARLVAEPFRELHVLELTGIAGEEGGIDRGDAGELLDEVARRQYRARLDDLREEIGEAEARDDLAAAENARAEMEQLTAELARAFGLDGRARRAGSAAERARVNAQRRIKDAIRRIGAECPAAGRHLQWAVRTGTFCSYRPA